ncbi:MAG: sigma-70 family RNA polymerase sigma factor [Fimbriiglobus sp.]
MAGVAGIWQRLHRFAPPAESDAAWLARFQATQDEAAFAGIMARYSGLVWCVCRRQLKRSEDIEDAYQTTFLALATKPHSVRDPSALAAWLHGTAWRVAVRIREQRRGLPLTQAPTAREDTLSEALQALDDELTRLPEHWRLPVLLCHLQDRTQEQAATDLGISMSTLRRRLEKGRERLRVRLERRGIELAGLLTLSVLSASTSAATLPNVASILALTASIPTHLEPILTGVFSMMFFESLRTMALKVAAVFVALLSLGVVTHLAASPAVTPEPKVIPADPAIQDDRSQPKPPETFDPEDPRYAGFYRGTVAGPDGKPLAGANVYLTRSDNLTDDPGPLRTITGEDGIFEFWAKDMVYDRYDGRPSILEGRLIVVKEGYGPDWFKTWGTKNDHFREYWTPIRGAKIALKLAVDDVPIRGRFLGPDGKALVGASVSLDAISLPYQFDLDVHLKRESQEPKHFAGFTARKTYERSLSDVKRVPKQVTETKTDAEGRFSFTGVGRERLAHLRVRHLSIKDADVVVMTRKAPNVVTDKDENDKPREYIYGSEFTAALKPGYVVRGIVRDRETKAPISNVWVTKNGHPDRHPHWNRDVVTTGADGRFEIYGLDPMYATDEERIRKFEAFPKPGCLHWMSHGFCDKGREMVIECVRGIPFTLKLLNESGQPYKGRAGDVQFLPLKPNLIAEELLKPEGFKHDMAMAAHRGDGIYEGLAFPGPGAIVVDLPDGRRYRPARVDVQAFFQGTGKDFGTTDTLKTLSHETQQTSFEAIVLINTAKEAKSIEVTAKLERDRPREVRLVDQNNRPVADVDSHMRWPLENTRETLKESTFQLQRLHPDRPKQMTFYHDKLKLAGYLLASGDSDQPITVSMLPWGTITGRLVDPQGKPLAKQYLSFELDRLDLKEDLRAVTDEKGIFQFTKVLPNLSYHSIPDGNTTALVTLDGKPIYEVILKPGETLKLGDVKRQ